MNELQREEMKLLIWYMSLTEKEPEDSELVPFTPALFGLWPAPDKSVDLVSLPPQ
ncbi:hypothetical protein H0H92_001299, partial [Tricholoma furcatifolium]